MTACVADQSYFFFLLLHPTVNSQRSFTLRNRAAPSWLDFQTAASRRASDGFFLWEGEGVAQHHEHLHRHRQAKSQHHLHEVRAKGQPVWCLRPGSSYSRAHFMSFILRCRVCSVGMLSSVLADASHQSFRVSGEQERRSHKASKRRGLSGNACSACLKGCGLTV